MTIDSGANMGNKKLIDYVVLDGCCEIQCTGEECASVLGIDYDTLNNRLKEDGNGGFSEYFRQKSANGKKSLRRKQFEIAEDGNPTMLIWLGKQWLGQKEPDRNDSGATGDVAEALNNIADKLPS